MIHEVTQLVKGKYPYITVTGKLKKFIEMIPKMGVPPKLTQPTLPTLGFKSVNDRPIVTILQFIGFLNDKNEPTQDYKDFRVQDKAKNVMASAIRRVYPELLELYPDACEKDNETLKNFFTPTTDAGEQVVDLTVATFKTLCSFADFKGVAQGTRTRTEDEEEETTKKGTKSASVSTGLTVNLNIQLTLPMTDNEKVYENIFKALKDNLLTREPKTD